MITLLFDNSLFIKYITSVPEAVVIIEQGIIVGSFKEPQEDFVFTGVIQDIGKIENIGKRSKDISIKIRTEKLSEKAVLGDSIAVNGICLTVSTKQNGVLGFDVMNETISKTSLKYLKTNDYVNLEPAMKLGNNLDGHIVQGHIDTTGTIISKQKKGESLIIEIKVPDEFFVYIAPRGSIAVDGISLTIAEKKNNIFKISLVDFTLAHTSLPLKKTGEKVNIEFDIIGKYLYEFYKKNVNSL